MFIFRTRSNLTDIIYYDQQRFRKIRRLVITAIGKHHTALSSKTKSILFKYYST